ncbi:hypothetical protein ACQY0O_005917 [Thecaphora frezii]
MPASQEQSADSRLHLHTSPSHPSTTADASSSSFGQASSPPLPPPPHASAEPIEIHVDPSRGLASSRSGSRRPPPSPANSPGNLGAATFTSLSAQHPLNAYKRARTVSPIIDDNSDIEQEHRSVHSQAASDNDTSDNASQQQSLPLALPSHPTPLRESHSFSSEATSLPTAAMSGPSPDASDKTIEGLMTEQSLRLDDPAARSHEATLPSAVSIVDASQQAEELPSYSDVVANDIARPSGAEQLKLIRPMKTQPMVVGETWYLIDRSWYKLWNTACAQNASAGDGEEPVAVGPIDNSPLLDEDSSAEQATLRTQINEGIDFEMLPEPGWTLLSSWYGVNGPVFARKVVEGINPGQESVEFYPPLIRFLKVAANHEEALDSGAPIFKISASQPLSDLKAKARELLALGEVEDTDLRFWHVPEPVGSELQRGVVAASRIHDQGVEVLDANEGKTFSYRPHVTLKELGLDELEMTLAVETRLDGRWLSDPAPAGAAASSKGIFAQTGDFFNNLQQQKSAVPAQLSTASAAPSSPPSLDGRATRSTAARDRGAGGMRGLRGLNNLGNTCFMNSALQCLSNTYELQQYFASGVFKEELNTDNPLGMGGAIAEAFGNLIQQLWNGQGGSFYPREFKHALARFAPQFSGYAQHDSQELLAFLLDGLHEDLNRIIKKPYVEAPDWMGGGEKEMVAFAKKQWDLYKARNDSVIVDLFQGQYKSTLVCPECEKVSIKFDPFMYLTLPIPNKKKWRCPVYFVPYDPAKQVVSFEVQLPAGANVGQLRQKVASHFGVDAKKLIGGEVWSHRMFKWIPDYEPVIDIKVQDYIYFWELPFDYRPPKRTFKSYRYHSTVADAEDGLVILEEEAAILPVFTSVESGSAGSSGSRAFMSRRSDHKAVGLPFFVAVPKIHINDPAAINKIVLEQYKRFSSVPELLNEAAVAASAPANAGGMQDWELVDSNNAPQDAVIDMVEPLQPSSTGVVTEIREDGVAIEVPDLQADEAPVMVEKPSEPVPKPPQAPKPLFSTKFTTVTEAGNPFPKGGNNDSCEQMAEDLVERLARLGPTTVAAQGSGDADGEVVDVVASNLQNNVDDDAAAMLSPPSTPEPQNKSKDVPTAGGPLPLVYTSGALVCSWPAAAFEKYLVACESGHRWGQYAEAVDNEIRKESGAATAKPKALSIEDCMDEFTKEEKLGEDDPWYCPSCKDFRQATKKFDLWKAPDILVVHLKRFSAGRHSRDKLNVNIDFPLEGLDLSHRVEGSKAAKRVRAEAAESGEVLGESMYGSGILQPENDNDDAVAIDAPIYDLYGVDNHFGGLGGGHYTAYAKNPSDGKWYEFDDSSVRPVPDPETVKSSSAYLLFYRRRTTRPIGGKSRQKFQKAVDERAAASQTAEPDRSGLDRTFDEGSPRWTAPNLRLSSPEPEAPHPPGWLPPFGRRLDDDDFEMFKPSSPEVASSVEGAEAGSPRSTLSSVGTPEAD